MPDTDLVFYLDADAVVTNPLNNLDKLVEALGGKDILIGEDRPNHVNTGVWLAKPSSVDILRFWERTPLFDRTLCNRWPVDEAGFDEKVKDRYRDRIVVKTRQELNLVNGFVHHQMVGDQSTKRRVMSVFNKRD
jgi:hypothetical protein